ncbi:MAG: hypothetical protein D8M58_16720 [Calditrichaeota bacterium]|nr:MAG: hypothetical protein DWQ03_08450 [Calditrichota bacterium]MBL1207050.1 hypothetical protein [Calditrichota bacterium]NOG46878.1 hypothetical protein [Calditrichota bacterium]
MKFISKLNFILCTSLVILIPITLKAQVEFIPNPTMNIFTQIMDQSSLHNHFHLQESFFDKSEHFSNRTSLIVNKLKLSEDVVDSVIYIQYGNKYKNSLHYDNKINILISLLENWDNNKGIWINNQRSTNTYDDNKNVLISVSESWDTTSTIWVNNSRRTNSYDVNGNSKGFLTEIWDNNSGIWTNNQRSA